MDACKIVEKLTNEIIEHFRLPKSLCFPFIKKILSWVYVAGWEEGRKAGAKRTPVVQIDKSGNIVKIHKSLKDAGRKIKITKSNISKAISGVTNSAGGYWWRKVSKPDEIEKILEGWQKEL